jgi:predicted ATPase/transcriptional regulator with GAF, ATPase, and Fis domain
MDIPGYDVLEEFVRHGPYVVYRARRQGDHQPVLIKSPERRPPHRPDSEALERQFALLRGLSVAGVPRPCDLIRDHDRTSLVLEDSGLTPLRSVLSGGRLDVLSVLNIASHLCAVLGELHRRKITHGALNPSSVLVHLGRSEVQLLNIGLVAGLSVEAGGLVSGRTTAYMSPEQTGRMNRAIDYRTDFYSLGITLYELLTGAPPFVSSDSLELIHAHIARLPAPLSQVDEAIPEQLSLIVGKLLAKSAEDRYQSASGLKQDIDRCLSEWAANRTISVFDLAQHDVPDRFLISQKLYGRNREVAELLHAFDETCEGRTGLMLVSGYSGIGKTSLIHELYKPIVRQRGYFIAGKFDQVVRNIPYGALTQALRSLVWQLLTESEDRLSLWRARLSDALGTNGGVLAEVIPEIELIIGKQAPPPPLDPTEARNRFGYVFQSFISALARKEHPLVVFLDDLQWVDAATLDLLHGLLTGPGIQHLLLIGAYRDNEVDDSHLLTWAVNRLEASGGRLSRLSLGPLALQDLAAFLRDTLHREPSYIEPIAGLIQKKTDGNPFFVIQFLKMLEQEGLLIFESEYGGWSFGIDAIAAAGMTDNVVDLMTRKIRRLSTTGQHVLTMAACVGNQFDWSTFVTICRQSPEDAEAGLAEALQAGLLHEADDTSKASDDHASGRVAYSFLHDRVQQAAYDLIPEAQKKPIHLDVGRLLLAEFDADAPDDRIFTIVNHLNIGADLIDTIVERLAVARLNLAAGRKAKTSAAYRAALDYFAKGISLLDESAWSAEYELMFSLHLEAAECQYLDGAFDAAEESFRLLLLRATRPLDLAQIHSLRITLYENQSRWLDAVSAGRDGLTLFDISFPERTEDKLAALDREADIVETLVGGRGIASLIDLPEMTDANMRMVMRILTILWAPAYIAGDEVLARLISATMVRLSIAHGHTEDSAYGYVTHAIMVGPIRRDYRSAYEWGTLALQVNRRFDDLKRRAKIHQQFQAHVNLWCRPFESCIQHAREASRSGLEAGDFPYAGYGAATEAWSAFLISRDLDRFVRDYTPTLALLERIKMIDFLGAHRILLNWAQALQGRTAGRLSLSDATFDEQQFIETHQRGASFFLTFLYVARLHLNVLLGEFSNALAAARQARTVAVTGTIWPVLIDFWGGLAAAATFEDGTDEERSQLRRELVSAEKTLAELTETCPENFRCMSLVLSAEIKRVESHLDQAATLLDDAISYARQTSNLQQEALASELCAKIWVQRHDEFRARQSMNEAYRCYAAWGATSKLAQLEERYGELLTAKALAPAIPLAVADTGGTSERVSVDMSTVLKVAHAIAVEIEVGELLRKLMTLALENAGADRGIFVQERQGALLVEADAGADRDHIAVGSAIPLDQATDLAISVVRYVHRTGQDVVIGNATRDERFSGDPYILASRAKSILCVPVAHQGRLRGILYLENNLTTDAFTPDRIEVMRILAAQTAISLENARLYENMKSEVERRTVAEQALREALSEVEALKNRLEAENVYLQEEIRTQHNFNEIVGNSPVLLDTLRKVERVAPTDSTVLIIGETGSGKELFARAVHSRSRRSDRPLVKVNCGAIAPGLVESELFGHVKGAFTGAIEKRVGRFELANGGTIFLDEIGELPLDAQVKLLRVLQEQEFEPLGSSKTIRVSVRVIAATNRNLDQAVRDGKFRADLLYRLNVFPIDVPALRERTSDIRLLVGFFSSTLARRIGKPIQGFSARSMERLARYSWPGNVRELQNVVERAAILAQGPVLELEGTVLDDVVVASAGSAEAERSLTVIDAESLDDVQRLHIINVLRSTKGVVEGDRGAATILGINPNTLRSRMKKLGIATPPRGKA